jgi:hypothetical protein
VGPLPASQRCQPTGTLSRRRLHVATWTISRLRPPTVGRHDQLRHHRPHLFRLRRQLQLRHQCPQHLATHPPHQIHATIQQLHATNQQLHAANL